METDAGMVPFDLSDCPKNVCKFTGQVAADMLDTLKTGESLHLEIIEDGTPTRLSWPLGSVAQMLDDFAAERKKRGLP